MILLYDYGRFCNQEVYAPIQSSTPYLVAELLGAFPLFFFLRIGQDFLLPRSAHALHSSRMRSVSLGLMSPKHPCKFSRRGLFSEVHHDKVFQKEFFIRRCQRLLEEIFFF